MAEQPHESSASTSPGTWAPGSPQDSRRAGLLGGAAGRASGPLKRLAVGVSRGRVWPHSRINVGAMERVASALAGGALLTVGLRRRSLGGTFVGGSLLYRGLTGHCNAYQVLGIDTAKGTREASMQGLEGSAVGTAEGARELRRSITIGKPASELYRAWRDAETLSQVMGGIAEVHAVSDDLQRWRVRGPLGRSLEWNSRLFDACPGEVLHWESLEGADVPNDGSVTFLPAPGDWGTVVTLHFRFDPPGGVLGDAVVKLLGGMPETLAHKVLRRFKSLMETGEIPSLENNPAARAGAHLH